MGRCLPPSGRPRRRAARCSVNLQGARAPAILWPDDRRTGQAVAAEVALVRAQHAALEPRRGSTGRWRGARRSCAGRSTATCSRRCARGAWRWAPGTLFEPGVWITAPGDARVRIGEGSFLNLNVMVASVELVEIGSHCMFANGCFVTDGNHRFDDREPARHVAGLHDQGPHARRRQRVVRRQRRRHQRRDDRRALRHRRQLRRHRRRAGRLDRRRLARARAEGDRMGGSPGSRRVVSIELTTPHAAYLDTMTADAEDDAAGEDEGGHGAQDDVGRRHAVRGRPGGGPRRGWRRG